MKRWLAMLLALACLTVPALGENEWDRLEAAGESVRGVVACENLAEAVSLRALPDAGAEEKCRLYAGAPLTVLNTATDAQGSRWALVMVRCPGVDLAGYLPAEQVMLANPNYGAACVLFVARTTDDVVALRKQPVEENVRATWFVSDELCLLGEIGEKWRLVAGLNESVGGYVRADQLAGNQLKIPDSWLMPGDGREQVTVYADKDLTEPIAAYYPGMRCRVTDGSLAEGWARVDELWAWNLPDDAGELQGYVRLADLCVFRQEWQAEYGLRTGVLRADTTIPAWEDGMIPQGASVTVLGQVGEKYHVRYGIEGYRGDTPTFLIDKEQVELTPRLSGQRGPERLGYACLRMQVDDDGWVLGAPTAAYPGQEIDPEGILYYGEGYTDTPIAEIIGQAEGWYQLRQYFEPNFYSDADQVLQVIREEDLWHDAPLVREESAWTASSDDAGLWLWTVAPGEAAQLTLSFPEAGALPETYEIQAEDDSVSFTVYIPAGTRVARTGGALTAATADNLPVLVDAHPDTFPVDLWPVFSGTGRFFCDAQLSSMNTYFNYMIQPVDGAEDSYCVISNLFTRPGEEGLEGNDPCIIRFADENETDINGDFSYVFQNSDGTEVMLVPGQFLEVHNCVICVVFGNG